ncbi:unnamed protein product [Rhizoctonia solani]|uniref:F-box domain-containing protein n=1 Tax=Rhizoctonia solani TaxID=456999 RepID=A0A8H3D379_9AGAM|nr:unnamed protein product [Rhizoctonia solani]
MGKSNFSLSEISPELVIQILHYCEYPGILSFAATCKTYHELVAQSTSLQLHIELEVNGLELVKGSFQRDASYSVILKNLKRFCDAWLDLDFEAPVERLVGNSEMLLWEMREGLYIRAFSRSEGRFSDALQLIPLDQKIPDPPLLTFDFTFNEFTADPGQALIAILSRDPDRDSHVHIHLRSSTTGLPHPLTRCPRLTAEFDFEPPYFWPGFSIEIMGYMVLAKVSHPQAHVYELLIWDWNSGVLLHRISSRQGICDFAFLDKRHLVVLSGSRSNREHLDALALLVYALSNDTSACATSPNEALRVADFSISEPILRLEFPQIKEASKVSETGFFLRSDPTPGRTIHADSVAFSCLYAITLSMAFFFREAYDHWGGQPYYRVFLDGRFLLDQIRTNPHGETKVLPWSSWGIGATRWFTAPDEPDHWINWMSSSRFITPLLNRPYYCIFDFSPPSVGRSRDRFAQLYPAALDHLVDNSDLAMADGFQNLSRLGADIGYFFEKSPPKHEFFVVTVGADNPSVIENDDDEPGFEESITSQLPYRLVFRANNRRRHEGWQINGDYVVGISSRGISEALTIYKLKK